MAKAEGGQDLGTGQNQAQRELLLREWEVNTKPHEAKIIAAVEEATQYTTLGLKSAYLLNGGAFVVMPALLDKFGICLTTNRHYLYGAAGFFLLGIIMTATANVFAYFAVSYATEMHFSKREVAALDVLFLHDKKFRSNTANTEKRDLAQVNTVKSQNKWARFRFVAITTALFSFGSFIGGACMLMLLALKSS